MERPSPPAPPVIADTFEHPNETSPAGPRRRSVWLAWIVGAVALAIVVGVAVRSGEAHAFAALVRTARPAWLLAGLLLQIGTYVCAGGIWWLCLTRAGSPQPLRRLTLLGVAKLFTDQALPSAGVAGTLLLVRAVVRRGVPLGVAMAAMVVNLLGFYAAFAAAAAGTWVLLAARREAGPLVLSLIGGLFVLAGVVPGTLLLLVRAGRSHLLRPLERILFVRSFLRAIARARGDRIRDPVAIAGSLALQLATILLDAATLAVMLAAVGSPARAGAPLAAYVLALIAETLGFIPGGLGTFEATCIAMLHVSGVAVEPALAATLLLRGFTFWLPMAPGLILWRIELRASSPR